MNKNVWYTPSAWVRDAVHQLRAARLRGPPAAARRASGVVRLELTETP